MHQYTIFFQGATGVTVFESTTDSKIYYGEIESHTEVFQTSISSATTYEFSVKLIAPEKEILTSSGTYATTHMESNEGTIKCYTNPLPIDGKPTKIKVIMNKSHFFYSTKIFRIDCFCLFK